MEVEVLSVEGAPPDVLVSLRAGHTRRQAPFSALGADGPPLCFPGGPAGLNPFKLDLLQPLGSTRMVLEPGPCRYTVRVGDEGPLVTFNVREAASAGIDRRERPESAQRGAGPGINPSKAEDNGKTGMKRSTSTPVVGSRPSSSGSIRDSALEGGFQATAQAAKEYLEGHEILPFVRALLQTVVRDRPEEPFNFIAEQFKTAAQAKEPLSADAFSKERTATPSTEASTRQAWSRPSSSISNRVEEQRPSAAAVAADDDGHQDDSTIPMVPEAADLAQEWVKIQEEQAHLEEERRRVEEERRCLAEERGRVEAQAEEERRKAEARVESRVAEEQAKLADERKRLAQERQRVKKEAAKQKAQRTEAEDLRQRLELAQDSAQSLSEEVNELKSRLDEAQELLRTKRVLGEEIIDQTTELLARSAQEDADNELELTKERARAALDAALQDDDEEVDEALKARARDALCNALLDDLVYTDSEDGDAIKHGDEPDHHGLESVKQRARDALVEALSKGEDSEEKDGEAFQPVRKDEPDHHGLESVKQRARDALVEALSKDEDFEERDGEAFQHVHKQMASLNFTLQALLAQAHGRTPDFGSAVKQGSREELELAKEEARLALEEALLGERKARRPLHADTDSEDGERRAREGREDEDLEAAKAAARTALYGYSPGNAKKPSASEATKRRARKALSLALEVTDSEDEQLDVAKAKARQALYAALPRKSHKASASDDAVRRRARKALCSVFDVTDSEEERLDATKARARKALYAALLDEAEDDRPSGSADAAKYRAREALSRALDAVDSLEERLQGSKARARKALHAALEEVADDDRPPARVEAAKRSARKALSLALEVTDSEDEQLDVAKAKARQALYAALPRKSSKASASDDAVRRKAGKALCSVFDVTDSEEERFEASKAKAREALSAALADEADDERPTGLEASKARARDALYAALLDVADDDTSSASEDAVRRRARKALAIIFHVSDSESDSDDLDPDDPRVAAAKVAAREALCAALFDTADDKVDELAKERDSNDEVETQKSLEESLLGNGGNADLEVEGHAGVSVESGLTEQQPQEAWSPAEIHEDAVICEPPGALNTVLSDSEVKQQAGPEQAEDMQVQSPKSDTSPKLKKRVSFVDAEANPGAPGDNSEPLLTNAELEEARSIAQGSLMAALGITDQSDSTHVSGEQQEHANVLTQQALTAAFASSETKGQLRPLWEPGHAPMESPTAPPPSRKASEAHLGPVEPVAEVQAPPPAEKEEGDNSEPLLTNAELEEAKSIAQGSLMAALVVAEVQAPPPAEEEERFVAEAAAQTEEERIAAEKKAEEERTAAEAAAKAEEEPISAEKKAEEDRLTAEVASEAEEERIAAEKKAEEERSAAEAVARAEEERIAAEKKAEEERLAAEAAPKAEEERMAAEKNAEEEKLGAEAAAKDEEERIAAERKAEEEKLAAQAKKAEEERLAAEAEEERMAVERKVEEEKLAAEAAAKAEEEERTAAEAAAKAEEERLAAEKKAEEERLAAEAAAKAEEERVAAEKNAEEERRAS